MDKDKRVASQDSAVLNVEFHVASFASMTSTTGTSRKDKRLLEIATLIKKCFEPVVALSNYPRSQIDVFIQILQSDGGLLHVGINAACLALIDAGISMTDYVSACSIGIGKDETMIDLNYTEESTECPCLTIAMAPKSGKLTLCNLECRLHMDK